MHPHSCAGAFASLTPKMSCSDSSAAVPHLAQPVARGPGRRKASICLGMAAGLSRLFACLISGMGILIFHYTASYLDGDPRLFRLYRFLLLFNSAMMGVVLADILDLLFVLWELTSVASFLLIGFNSERKAACEGAGKAVLTTGSGGLVMLMGVFLTYADTGTFELSTLLTEHPHISTAGGLSFYKWSRLIWSRLRKKFRGTHSGLCSPASHFQPSRGLAPWSLVSRL